MSQDHKMRSIKLIVASNPRSNQECIERMIREISEKQISADIILILGDLSVFKMDRSLRRSIKAINSILDKLVDLDSKVFYTLGELDPQYDDIIDDINLDASYLPFYRKIKVHYGFYLSSYSKFANEMTVVASQNLSTYSDKALFNIEGNGHFAILATKGEHNYLNVGYLHNYFEDLDRELDGIFFEISIESNGAFDLHAHPLDDFNSLKKDPLIFWMPEHIKGDPLLIMNQYKRKKIFEFLNLRKE